MARAIYFLGHELPYEARLSLRIMPTLETLEPILEAILAGTSRQVDAAKKLQRESSLDSTSLGAIFTGLDWFIRTSARSSLKQKALAAELVDSKVHAPFIEPLLRAVDHVRQMHSTGEVPASGALIPTLNDLRWRLDVTISTSALKRVLRPQLTMQCDLSDGSTHAFHVSKQVRKQQNVPIQSLPDIDVLIPRRPLRHRSNFKSCDTPLQSSSRTWRISRHAYQSCLRVSRGPQQCRRGCL